jgi:hypothetical protein
MSCSCGGSNENCMHCFGSGSSGAKGRGRVGTQSKSLGDKVVLDFVREHPRLHGNSLQTPEGSEAKHRPRQANGQPHESPSEELCDRSFVSSSPTNVRSVHLRASKRGSQIVDVRKAAKDASTPTCPLCHVKFAHQIELRSHMQVGCAKPKATALPRIRYVPRQTTNKSLDKVVSKAGRKMTKCPHCDWPVKSTNLQKHFGRCPKYLQGHSTPSARKSVQHTKAYKKRVVSPFQHKPPDSVEEQKHLDLRTRYQQVNRRDPIDATKLYAHSFRENGKFGSHPLHDGMDDESGPD